MSELWTDTRARLQRLRDLWPPVDNTVVFGSQFHRCELVPALTEAEVAEAEAQFGVRLPEEYRSFVIEVAAGGAGPFYGVYPLSWWEPEGWGWWGPGSDLADLTTLGTAFEPGDLTPTLTAFHEVQPPAEDREASRAWYEQWLELLYPAERTRGAICLCHQGSGYRSWLAISGPLAGQMWNDHRVDDRWLTPHTDGGGAVQTFARWYLDWLDEAEAAVFGDEGRGEAMSQDRLF